MKNVLVSIIISALLLIAMAGPVLALSTPTSVSIQSVKVVQNVAAAGDMAVFFHYKIVMPAYPVATSATNSIIFRLYDGTNLLATATPFDYSSFTTNGYGDGVSCFYFAAADAPAWLGAYTINVYGIPLYFTPALVFNYVISPSEYSNMTLMADSQNDLQEWIFDRCDDFASIYPAAPLKASTDDGICLSNYGESYFRGACPGIQSMAPGLFYVQVSIPTELPATGNYTMGLATTLSTTISGSDLERGATRVGAAVGISSGFFWGILAFIGSIVCTIWTYAKGWGPEPGLIASGGVITCIALFIGGWAFTIIMIGGFLAGVALMYILVFKRA